MTQFPGQHSMGVISIMLVPPAGCIGIAHNKGCPHPISHMGVASDKNKSVNLRSEINHIGSYSYQNIIEIRNM